MRRGHVVLLKLLRRALSIFAARRRSDLLNSAIFFQFVLDPHPRHRFRHLLHLAFSRAPPAHASHRHLMPQFQNIPA